MNADLAALVDNLATGGPEATEMGELLHARMTELYPLPRSLTGDGVRASLALLGTSSTSSATRFPPAPRPSTGRSTTSGTSATRRSPTHGRRGSSTSRAQPARGRLQRARARDVTLRRARPHLHSLPGPPRLDPVPDLLLPPDWGFCLERPARCEPRRRPVRRRHRRRPRARLHDLRRARASRARPTTRSGHRQRVPPRRSPTTTCRASWSRPSSARTCGARPRAAVHLPLPVRPGHDRRDPLAEPQPRGLAADQARRWCSPGSAIPGRWSTSAPAAATAESTARWGTWSARRGGEVRGYSPYGYDERQFNSLGFDLPFGRLSRTPYGEYPEYHTSADNLDYVQPSELATPTRRWRSSTSWRATTPTSTRARTASRSSASAASTRRPAARRRVAR